MPPYAVRAYGYSRCSLSREERHSAVQLCTKHSEFIVSSTDNWELPEISTLQCLYFASIANAQWLGTQLSSQHPFHYWEHHGGGVDLSTIPPTPLPNHRHLLSPIRQPMDGGSSTSHRYFLRSTPDRLAASGSCREDAGLGKAVAGGSVVRTPRGGNVGFGVTEEVSSVLILPWVVLSLLVLLRVCPHRCWCTFCRRFSWRFGCGVRRR